jgi:hypothetical protein
MKRRSFLGIIAGLPLANSALAAPGVDRSDRYVIDTDDRRRLEVFSWRPSGEAIGRIQFSHGFASAPRHYMPMIAAWVAAGYAVDAPLHMDSREHPARSSLQGMDGWAARIHDMRALSASHGAPHATIGHSYGGLTALAMGGASAFRPDGIEGPLRDDRTVCAVAFSPPGPLAPLIEEAGYGSIAVPAFIQTGTRDVPASSAADPESWRSHLAAFTAGSGRGDRYALVLEGVDHYFGGLIGDPAMTGPDRSIDLNTAIAGSLTFLASHGPAGSGTTPLFAADAAARFYRR